MAEDLNPVEPLSDADSALPTENMLQQWSDEYADRERGRRLLEQLKEEQFWHELKQEINPFEKAIRAFSDEPPGLEPIPSRISTLEQLAKKSKHEAYIRDKLPWAEAAWFCAGAIPGSLASIVVYVRLGLLESLNGRGGGWLLCAVGAIGFLGTGAVFGIVARRVGERFPRTIKYGVVLGIFLAALMAIIGLFL